MRVLTLILCMILIASSATASVIPQAMKWKYGANCTDNKAGDDIVVWEHPTLPRPGKAQIASDVNDYNTYIANYDSEQDSISTEELILREKMVDLAIDALDKEHVALEHADKLKTKFKNKDK